MQRVIQVVAGALCNGDSVLIAQRPSGKHMAGGWEFPGGKVNPGESALDALKRELKEELDIDVHNAVRLDECQHDYPDRRVHLQLWLIRQYSGEPVANENQPLQWVRITQLNTIDMLPADEPLVAALQQFFRVN